MPFLDTNHQRAAVLILLLAIALVVGLAPFATGLIGIPVLYVLFQPLHDALARRFHPPTVAALVVAAALLVVFVPGVSLVTLIVAQAQSIASGVAGTPLLARISELQLGGFHIGPNLVSLGQDLASWVGTSAFSLVGTATKLALNIVVSLFGLYYLLLRPGDVWDAFRPYVPFSPANTEKLRRRFRDVTISTVIGTGLTGVIQAALVALGFWATGLSNALFWGLVGGVLAVLPVVGTGLVWIPGAIALLLGHRPTAAVLLLLWGALIVGNVEYFVQPWVFRRWAKVHPLVTLVGALAAIPEFGILGLLIGPLALSYFFELLKMYREEYLAPTASP